MDKYCVLLSVSVYVYHIVLLNNVYTEMSIIFSKLLKVLIHIFLTSSWVMDLATCVLVVKYKGL